MKLSSPVTDIKGVGPEVAKKLAVLGVRTVQDLVDFYPRRYEDYSSVEPIKRIKPGMVTVKATIKSATGRYVSRGLHITEAAASDKTGSVRLMWFNQPYRASALKVDQEYYISGDFGLRRQRLSIQNPSVELVSDFPVNTARIVPKYRETKGLSSHQIRRAIRETLPVLREVPEILPTWLIQEERLMSRADAIEQIHFPTTPQDLLAAKRRLGFEEVFELTLAALLNKYELQQTEALHIPFDEKLARSFVRHLPFKLTDEQRRVIWQIYQDMERGQPMNRLVEGDVGSGKTVVAVMAAVMAMRRGFQAAFMAPTELLARQHADSLYSLLEPLDLADQMGLLVGSLKPAQKKSVHDKLKSGAIRLLVGTHALIQEKVDMHKLGLVVIDEQHRFGVEQRKRLQAKAGHMPHVLSLTATPIPRSLALTLYGELDISVIAHKPAGREAIKTVIVPHAARYKTYEAVERELSAGRQAFVVCPLVGESELVQAKSAEQTYIELSSGSLKKWRLGLLHGKLKSEEKERVMNQFVSGKIDVLVATTVVEVGVDVPNASVMVVESPERFGLAQMHQLRGRVGRSSHQGHCYLQLSDNLAPSNRLKVLEQSSDGFKLAEYDLELRGPGAIYGTLQHGQLDLRVAKLSDTKLIAVARKRAQEFIDRGENLLKYTQLYERVKSNRSVTNLN